MAASTSLAVPLGIVAALTISISDPFPFVLWQEQHRWIELLLAIPKTSCSSKSDKIYLNKLGSMSLGLSDEVGVRMGGGDGDGDGDVDGDSDDDSRRKLLSDN